MHAFFSSAIFFFQKFFQEHHQSVKISLDSEQANRFVRPDLGSNYLQKFYQHTCRVDHVDYS